MEFGSFRMLVREYMETALPSITDAIWTGAGFYESKPHPHLYLRPTISTKLIHVLSYLSV